MWLAMKSSTCVVVIGHISTTRGHFSSNLTPIQPSTKLEFGKPVSLV